jgi:hypothetical protein
VSVGPTSIRISSGGNGILFSVIPFPQLLPVSKFVHNCK